MGTDPPIDTDEDDFDRWHLFGVPGCIHEHDDPFHVRIEQSQGSACDCDWIDPDA